MANYLLDSTIIIDCLRGKKGRDELLKKLVLEGSTLGCCSVNIVEVHTGMKNKEREKTTNLLNSLEYYNITREMATLAGEYRRNYWKKGKILSVSDVLIAAVAISYNLILITDNRKHYPMPEIKIAGEIE
ncbi:MAG: PIN domain-containing protein [Patescibacteria group bacterium]|nr:PIN domain-containing protein [Patescibacteria group bacterium]